MNEDDLTRCGTCYAYVKLASRHRAWHEEQDQKMRRLQSAINALQQKVR